MTPTLGKLWAENEGQNSAEAAVILAAILLSW